MKYTRWLSKHILFILTLFLFVFIPLYPKKPLLDIVNTWVYIRAEDFVVVLVLGVMFFLLIRKKISLKSPLTAPILLFWIAGAIATFHGVLIVFPDISHVFPNVAFLSYLRRIEYISLFFVAYASFKDRRQLLLVIAVLVGSFLAVVAYGFGQKYAGFPAYLTMNEEFAKGIPLQLSPLSRVSSTFGGHYDLAAYTVLLIPIFVSLIFGVRQWFLKAVLILSSVLGFGLLFMTVSRVSFFALLVGLGVVLFFQKKKIVLVSLPLIAFAIVILVGFTPALLNRFVSTIKEVDVLIDAETGEVVGHPEEVDSVYFEHKLIRHQFVPGNDQPDLNLFDKEYFASFSATASPSATIPYTLLPPKVLLISAANTSTGENLPQGTGYINLSLSPVTRRVSQYFYDTSISLDNTDSSEVFIIFGDFLIKRALAYDLSFTTRFQGEWPRALLAFKRNILFGSGYASVSLAVDNNYLRILAETGLIGFVSFFALFAVIGIYMRKIYPDIASPLSRSFVIGFAAGVVGLFINAVLIDVFEASKIALYLWLLAGVTVGLLHAYNTVEINLLSEFRKIATSSYAVIFYLFITTILLFSPMLTNYFVGDDFTWFRWVADCDSRICGSFWHYLTQADGFFYRPGAKLYFFLMYKIFWLNQTVYHTVSLSLHFFVSVLVFYISRKIIRSFSLSVLASFLFLSLSGFSEAVFWISSTGFLFTSVCSLSSLLLFIMWNESGRKHYFVLSVLFLVLGLFFHELGIVTPFLLLLYKILSVGSFETLKHLKKLPLFLLFVPLFPYLLLRYSAGSHWFSGDYNYNLLKLPFNIVGNVSGYFSLALFGPSAMPFYNILRTLMRENLIIALAVLLIVVGLLGVSYRIIAQKMVKDEKRVVIFGMLFFLIALLPFLGLGNMTSRYSYLASVGFIIVFVYSMKKIHRYLQSSGSNIALMSMAVVISVFALFHIIQIQKINGDWRTAGEKVQNFFLAIDVSYQDYWSNEPMKFYFVNVPIRIGEAWAFPVGLSDALWFTFRNPAIAVYQMKSVEEAFDLIRVPKNEKVFVFDGNGSVTERSTNPLTDQ